MMLAALALAAGCLMQAPVAAPRDILSLDHHVEILREGAADLQFADVTRAPACERFSPSSGPVNFGGAGGSLWLRFRADLPAHAAAQWRLALRFPGLQTVCVHWPLTGGATAMDCTRRDGGAAEDQRWKSGRLLFPVPAAFDSRGTVYMQVQSRHWLRVPLELATADALLERDQADEFDRGIYYGLMLALAAFGLMFFVAARDRTQLYYALHVAALSLALMSWHGQLARFDPGGETLTRIVFGFVGLFIAAGSGFYQRFLDTAGHLKHAHRLLEACAWGGLALGASVWLAPLPATQLLALLGAVWIGAALWASAARLRQGYRPALLALAALLALLSGIVVAIPSALGRPLMDSGLALLQLGGLASSALLALAMMFRVRRLIHERDRADELAQASQKLALHRISHDELTNLPKRSRFREELQERLADARRNARKLALVSLSLDNFRALGHALGAEESDAALAETALRLREGLAAGELLGSIGNNGFAWLTAQGDSANDHAELRARCQALRATLAAPLARARGASVSVSMGVALYPQHGSTAGTLMRDSDEALYRAQQQSVNLEIFQPALGGQSERNLELSTDLQQAILRDQLLLYYQPIVPLDARGGLYAAEALVRWHNKGQMVMPDQFIRVAESTGLIVPLSDWVLRQACRQLADWRRRKLPVISISVNISAQEFRLPGFAQRVEKALAETSAPASGLVLELTEGVLVEDLAGAAEILQQLATLGLRVAVDDFGVGYSSLSYLRNLPVHSIKIDRSFLQGIPGEVEAVSVLGAIITMGRELGLKLTAEGIESEEQMNFLARRGVNAGQGWLFAKAMPIDQFESWLQQRTARSAA